MAGSLLDIYGLYNQALRKYQNEADIYNAAGQAWNKSVEDYNASIISDSGAYKYAGNYSGSGPYTIYNGYTVGRTGAPLNTYQTEPTGYKYTNVWSNEDVSPEQQYDIYGNNVGVIKTPIYSGTNETTYVDPTTGLASVFAARPSESFDMVAPTAPIAPPPQEVTNVLGNIDPTQLYQTLFGKPTPDVMSSEAMGLQNISSPFLSSETNTAYDTGGVNRMNNPLAYVGPDVLTTGQGGYDINSVISGQMTGNPYY
jgi:hypothetical protein